jgi:hypothetical protein
MNRNRWFPWIIIAGMLTVSAALFNQLPAVIPMGWNLSGDVISEQPRLVGALALPIFAAVVLLREGLPRIDPLRENYAEFRGTYRRYIRLIVLGLGVIYMLLLGSAIGWQLSPPGHDAAGQRSAAARRQRGSPCATDVVSRYSYPLDAR